MFDTFWIKSQYIIVKGKGQNLYFRSFQFTKEI